MKNSEDLIELLQAADTDKNGTINYTGKCLPKKILESI